MSEPVDATVVEEHEQHALVPTGTTLAVTPQVSASDLVERLGVIREAQTKAMVKDVDYGVIPGTDKPALYKPGAEKLSVLFQLDVQLVNEQAWGPGDHLTVTSRATVYHAPTGTRLGYGEGVCSTREKKYAKRKQERICPYCGQPAVIKGKAEYGGGWLCWKKRDGCGVKFAEGDQAIESQPVGEVDNPDLPDLWNTITKMAEKRARVDAVLAVTGASALFTQDVEDPQKPEPVPFDEPEPAPAPQDKTRQGNIDSGVASPSDIRAIYEKASHTVTARELLSWLLEAQDMPPEDVDERAALGRINDVIRTLPKGRVREVLGKIP